MCLLRANLDDLGIRFSVHQEMEGNAATSADLEIETIDRAVRRKVEDDDAIVFLAQAVARFEARHFEVGERAVYPHSAAEPMLVVCRSGRSQVRSEERRVGKECR